MAIDSQWPTRANNARPPQSQKPKVVVMPNAGIRRCHVGRQRGEMPANVTPPCASSQALADTHWSWFPWW